MSGKLTIGFNQVPRTLYARTGKYGILRPQASLTRTIPAASKDPRGFWTGINPEWETFNDSGSFSYTGGTGQITGDYSAGGLPGGHNGTQSYGGNALVLNSTAPVVNFAIANLTAAPSATAISATLVLTWGFPTGAYTVLFTEAVGGATESRSVTFTNGAKTATWSGGLSNNCITLISIASLSAHATTGVSFRYPWNTIEPTTAGNYVWDRLDADLAQCISRGCMWLPIIIVKTFQGNNPSPAPTYLDSITSPYSGTIANPNAYCMWRWNATFKTRFAALVAAIGARYDVVANFAGIATQETSLPNGSGDFAAFPTGTGYLDTTDLANLEAESDEISAACPTSWHWAYQNFIQNSQFGINYGDWLVDQYAQHIQGNNAILFGPDLVNGGSVVSRCYPRQLPYHNSAGGTVTRAAQSGWGGGSTTFTGGGGTGLALQNAEWLSQPPAQTNTPVQTAFDYGTSGVKLKIDICMMDWHQLNGSPNNQKFNPDGVNLVRNNASPFNTIWTP